MAGGDSDVALPKALTDFIFDLYDSVITSHLTEEQSKLYETDYRDLSSKYFGSQPWPSPQSIASECNGDPLFLAVYREMTHRHWHQVVSRPTLRDRMEGFQVYRELFDEVLDAAGDINFFLLPSWVFDIFHEFGYQFQGFCQVRSAVYSSARKHGLMVVQDDGTWTLSASAAATVSNNNNSSGNNNQQSNLLDNLTLLESTPEAWDVEVVFQYLHRFSELGLPMDASSSSSSSLPPVYTYFNIFGTITKSRIECLLGDFTSSLQALAPLTVHANYVIPKDNSPTVTDIVNSVFAAKLNLAYHTGVSLLMLRRYKDAFKVLGDICSTMMRGFKTGQLRKLPGSDQFNKQFERMLSILALIQFICPMIMEQPPGSLLDDAVVRAMREKHGARLEAASSYEEWFQSPKFVTTDTQVAFHRHIVQQFLREMEPININRTLRSYLQLYTSLPVHKMAKFYTDNKTTTTTSTLSSNNNQDVDNDNKSTTEDILPLLLAYKLRHRQLEQTAQPPNKDPSKQQEEETTTTTRASDPNNNNNNALVATGFEHGEWKDALNLHFYIVKDVIHVDEEKKQRRFEKYFFNRIEQNLDLLQSVRAIDTTTNNTMSDNM